MGERLSGIDECKRTIPMCTYCEEDTLYWIVICENTRAIAYLNYAERVADVNGEFNLCGNSVQYILQNATHMKCKVCGGIDNSILFDEAMMALKHDVRRYDFVRDR